MPIGQMWTKRHPKGSANRGCHVVPAQVLANIYIFHNILVREFTIVGHVHVNIEYIALFSLEYILLIDWCIYYRNEMILIPQIWLVCAITHRWLTIRCCHSSPWWHIE